jgi:hypothetical protein
MRLRQFHTLEDKAEAIGRKALDIECKNRSEGELKFFAVHGPCITVGRHYAETFDTDDVLVGDATGIDASLPS